MLKINFKRLAFASVSIVVLASPLVASADRLSDLQAQVAALLAQIAELQHTSPSTAPCVDLSHNLTLGSTGPDVSDLQDFLATKGYLNAPARGYYGFLTAQAVGQLQMDLGIVSSADDAAFGIVGPKTRQAIACGELHQDGSITVTAPNGGEQWEEGILNTVTWTPYGYDPDINPSKDVTAYLERQNEKDGSFETLGKVEESGKASIHWLTGELDSASRSNNFVPPADGYYIRVVNNKTGAWDRSDSPFTLLPRSVDLKINGSDGPVNLSDGEKVSMTWTASGKATNCKAYAVGAHAGESSIENLASSGTQDVYYFAYNKGYGGTITLQCFTEGNTFTNSDSVLVTGQSGSASLNVVSPNGGELIPLGQPYTIRWSQTGLSSVAIALYKNDKWFAWINKDVPNGYYDNQSYVWDLAANPWNVTALEPSLGNVYKIYITGQKTDGTGYVDDKSDAPFGFTGGSADTGFSALPTSGAAPLAVKFSIRVNCDGKARAIDYGDGQTAQIAACYSSGGTNTSPYYHTYTSIRTYTASLREPTDTDFHTVGTATITVTDGTNDTAFSAKPTSGAAPLTTTFSASLDACSRYSVDFGDGQVSSIDDILPTPHVTSNCYSSITSWPHTYTAEGKYLAKLMKSAPMPACYYATPRCMVTQPASQVVGTATITVGSAKAPTAIFTINGSTDTTLNVSDPLTYAWSSTNGASAKTTVMIYNSDGALISGPFQWSDGTSNLGTTLSGARHEDLEPAQEAGYTVVFTYTVTGSDGQTATATATKHVRAVHASAPTASLLAFANGAAPASDVTITDSDPVYFRWTSTNATAGTMSYTVNGGSSNPVTYWSDFNTNPLSGGTTVYFTGAGGETRVYTYQVKSNDGQTATSQITVRVGPIFSNASNAYANLANSLAAIAAILQQMRGGQ